MFIQPGKLILVLATAVSKFSEKNEVLRLPVMFTSFSERGISW